MPGRLAGAVARGTCPGEREVHICSTMQTVVAPRNPTSLREHAGVTATTLPSPAAELVQRLLSTEDAAIRRTLIERCALLPDELNEAVTALVNEAPRFYGADPLRMQRMSEDALALASISSDSYLIALASMCLGDAHRSQGRNREACVCYDEAAGLFKLVGKPAHAARTRIGWVEAMARLGKPRDALIAARSARRVLVAHGDTLRLATLELHTATIDWEQGRYTAASRGYTRALRLFASLGGQGLIGVARCLQNRGNVLARLGRYYEALSSLERAQQSFRRMGENTGAAFALHSTGAVYLGLGRYSAALRAFQQARHLAGTVGLENWLTRLDCETADCYLALNRPDDALSALAAARESLADFENAQDALGVATRRAAAYLALGRYDEAWAIQDQVESLFPNGAVQHRAWLTLQRAALLHHTSEYADAIELAQLAQKLAQPAGMRSVAVDAVVVEGRALLASGKTSEASRCAHRALRLARTLDAAPALHRSHELLGFIAESQGRQRVASKRYEAAIAQLERQASNVIFEFRDSFAGDKGEAYARLARLLVRAGKPLEALLTAERAKSRAVADVIAGAIEPSPRRTAEARRLARELKAVRAEYAACVRERAVVEDAAVLTVEAKPRASQRRLEERIRELVQRLQLTASNSRSEQPVDASDIILPQLSEETLLLEFFFCGDDILRFQVTHQGVSAAVLAAAVPDLERDLRLFRLNLDATEGATRERFAHLTNQASAILRRIHKRLLEDISLDSYSSLVVVPHGILHYLPFHALFDGERFLVERVAVTYAPSATVYGACQTRTKRGRGGLVLGHSSHGRLPQTLGEAQQVASVLSAPVYLESEATRGLIERSGHRAALIHIAAHGHFRPDAPLFSCIELADGPLTTADIYGLDLRARLVALSACETGRAVLGGGDELPGLARAFLCAGANCLLVSQWRVGDATTAGLMRRFYEALAVGRNTAQALQQAQLALISSEDCAAELRHPFFWAGFQVIGDDRAMGKQTSQRRKRASRND